MELERFISLRRRSDGARTVHIGKAKVFRVRSVCLAAMGAMLVAGSALAQVPQGQRTAAECGVKPIETYLALTLNEFDQAPQKGWRQITEQEGCDNAAADVIAQYRVAKYGSPTPKKATAIPARMEQLVKHEAMGRATAGDSKRAVELFRWNIAYDKAQGDAEVTGTLHLEASVAFLERDRAKLEKIRAELAAMPMPNWFREAQVLFVTKYPGGAPPRWPMHLDEVDDFIACFDKSYAEQFGCVRRMKGQ